MRSWLLLAGFLLALVCGTYAQNRSLLDSLRRELISSEGEKRFEVLNEMGFALRLSHPDSTIYYCRQAYELGKMLELSKHLSKPLSFIGLAYAYKGDYNRSFDYHVQSIDVAEMQNDSVQLAFCYNNFGRLFFDQGDLTRAYDNLINALDIFQHVNDSSGLAYVYRSLSNIHKSQGDYAKALEASTKAFQIRYALGEPRTLLSALFELGLVYSELKQMKEAERCFTQADSIAQRVGDAISQAEVQLAWAEYLMDMGDVNTGSELAARAHTLITGSTNQRLLPRARLLMGHVAYSQKQYAKAISFLEPLVQQQDKAHLDIQRDANFFLSRIYEARGLRTEAAAYTNKYLVLKESLISVELARQIEKLQFQLEIEKKERENEDLKLTEAKSATIIEQQKLQNVILIAVAIFVSALFFMQWRNGQKRKAYMNELARQNSEIDRQRAEIVRQNERLAKHNQELSELNHEKDTLMNIVAHDLKSPLNRIKGLAELIEMEGVLPSGQLRYLNLIRDSTRAGLDLITDLLDVNSLDVNREPVFSGTELSKVVQDRVGVFNQAAKAKEINLIADCEYLDVVTDADYLGRILDNLLSNAIKFSPPKSSIHIYGGQQNNKVVLSIRDEGPGFSEGDKKFLFQKFKKLSARPTAGESSNGLGLAIVKILVDRLAGKIELKSELGKGSEFIVRLPVKK